MAKRDEFAEKAIWADIKETREAFPELKELFYFKDAFTVPNAVIGYETAGMTLYTEILIDEEAENLEETIKERSDNITSLPRIIRKGLLEKEAIAEVVRKQMGIRYFLEGGHPSMFFNLPSLEATEAILEIGGDWEEALKILSEHGATKIYEAIAETDRTDFTQAVIEAIKA